MKYKYVLFDLDGTLLDTSEGIISSLNETVKIVGLPRIPQEDMYRFIGPPLELGIKNYFNINAEKVRSVASVFRNIYKTHNMFKAKPYRGVNELLKRLTDGGAKVAIATNKSHEYAIEIIEHFGLNRFCSCCFGSDNENRTTKDAIIEVCLTNMAAELKKSVYIGDTVFDAQSAANTGISFIGVTYGFGFTSGEENQTGALPCVGIASDISRLVNILVEEK